MRLFHRTRTLTALARSAGALVMVMVVVATCAMGGGARAEEQRVSFDREIRPIFQARCHGCHQPAKAKGDYVMTSFEQLLAGGSEEGKAVAAGRPDQSSLLRLITPVDGDSQMPKRQDPLHETEIALIRKWIAQGAVDDTPENAKVRYSADKLPTYSRPPVITALDFSPNGELLAVSGFHEVLLMKADGSQLVARLVGLSERIESLKFSPDGTKLAVAGGLPGRMGEVQVWDVAERKLSVSAPVTYDTVYGVSWSPDGKAVAFGCGDNTVRAINVRTGREVFFNGAHSDWSLGTAFTKDGKHLVSVGRDMTAKLHVFAEQRFVDNITSITPGALKGGILSIVSVPGKDEIVIGGSDGVPQVFRVFRTTARKIGDNANLIKALPAMNGRVNSVAISHDASVIAAGSSLDGRGQVFTYSYADGKTRAAVDVPGSAIYAVAFRPDGKAVAAAGGDGKVRLIDSTSGALLGSFSPAPIDEGIASIANKGETKADFILDANPVLSRLGCNAGTCHGAAKGKNGFKLSLRGYDPLFDVRALTDDHGSRRVNIASPDDSLMLLKATGAVPHEGGQLIKPNDAYYTIIRDWIASGAKLNPDVPRVARIELSPQTPVLADAGQSQTMRVVATYTNGMTRDVTREAFITSGNEDVAKADRSGAMKALRRGEAPVLARYEGAYAATTLTVMGNRDDFKWRDVPKWGRIDELVAAKWRRMKIQPTELCTDAEFVRRVSLDLTGLPPTIEMLRKFEADRRDTRIKRDELVDELIGSEAFIDYWSNKWADLLQVNGKFLGREGAKSFHQWIRNEVATNTPYDAFARKILTASGSNRENPAASYYKVLRTPEDVMENTTHLFLAIRFNCNKCHDHPFERWTQDQYYETAAFFAQTGLKADPKGGDKKIPGTAVEKPTPLYEVVYDLPKGEMTHERTQQVVAPVFPFDCNFESSESASRRERLAQWITSPDNPYFARSYANRLWGYLFGVGIIEPIDDVRASNPPTNPELLDHLTTEFIESGFDMRAMLAMICKSRTYQLSFKANEWNADDEINYSRALPRRLPAEVLYDAIHHVTGSPSKLPGLPAGSRAAALPDSGIRLPSGFLTTFGKPARESACECERSNELQLGPVMALISGPDVADAIGNPNNAIAKLVASEQDDRKLIDSIFLRVLNRRATKQEIDSTLETVSLIGEDDSRLQAALAAEEAKWAPTLAKLNGERDQRIAGAKQALADYEAKNAERFAKQKADREARIKRLEAELKQAEATLADRQAAWEAALAKAVRWVALDPHSMKASSGAQFAKEEDLSIFVTGPNKRGTYEIIATTDVAGITGVRLEALTDDRLPNKGPGRAADGNFVLSEFEVYVAGKDQPEKFAKVKLQNAQATFSQQSLSVATAIDGKAPGGNNGWAIHPQTGKAQTATFETNKDIGGESGSVIRIVMNQQYSRDLWNLGRFRVSVTDSARPIGGGPPPNIAKLLAIAADKRDDKQKAELAKFYRGIDPQLKKINPQLADARKPLPVDPQLKKLRDGVAVASKPVPIDADLLRLRRDAEISRKQAANVRLTMAQDLAWALINSPAFLFNH